MDNLAGFAEWCKARKLTWLEERLAKQAWQAALSSRLPPPEEIARILSPHNACQHRNACRSLLALPKEAMPLAQIGNSYAADFQTGIWEFRMDKYFNVGKGLYAIINMVELERSQANTTHVSTCN
ncbi:hypothetical protein [Aquitalea sp. ASV11]|uniref:hypothetical protein n=1 Tax=Aquitalea sp. ASV11 TaxID=2795103 RepID=UPI0018EAD6F2|nr:hypothetical protein [Aquitalea sp. ASV11]